MAYPQPYYYQPQSIYQPSQMQFPIQQPQNNSMVIQDAGFVSVRNEMEARNYPVGYGKSITFKDENAPYVYTKTMGFSQLETPRFEKYKLVKEEPETAQKEPFLSSQDKLPVYAEKSEIEAIWSEIEAIKKNMVKKEAEDE